MSPALALLAVRALLALGLYAFLAVILITLWRDLRRAGTGQAVPAAHLIHLAPGERAGAAYPLTDLNLIGRAPGNSIILDDATVSAHHARLGYHSGRWIVEDLGSRNGTRVNGINLEGLLVLAYGDDLQFGEVLLGLRAGPTGGTGDAGGAEAASPAREAQA